MVRLRWIPQLIVGVLFSLVFATALVGSLQHRDNIWLQVLATGAGSVFSLYGGYLLAAYLSTSQPNRELQKLGRGIGRELIMVAMQLKSYAKEVRGFSAS